MQHILKKTTANPELKVLNQQVKLNLANYFQRAIFKKMKYIVTYSKIFNKLLVLFISLDVNN